MGMMVRMMMISLRLRKRQQKENKEITKHTRKRHKTKLIYDEDEACLCAGLSKKTGVFASSLSTTAIL
jgi:hypothetical protein